MRWVAFLLVCVFLVFPPASSGPAWGGDQVDFVIHFGLPGELNQKVGARDAPSGLHVIPMTIAGERLFVMSAIALTLQQYQDLWGEQAFRVERLKSGTSGATAGIWGKPPPSDQTTAGPVPETASGSVGVPNTHFLGSLLGIDMGLTAPVCRQKCLDNDMCIAWSLRLHDGACLVFAEIGEHRVDDSCCVGERLR